MSHDDFAFEPIRGLPELLPPGERLIWQGAPDWRALALRVFHLRKIAVYFGLLALWQLGMAFAADEPWTTVALGVAQCALAAFATVGILAWLAWRIGRTTVYSITNRRVVMRFGVALPMTINVPYRTVESAALKLQPAGRGDISLALSPGHRLAYLVLWPHARPWRYARTEPTLRAVPDAVRVADMLSRALAAEIGGVPLAAQRDDVAATARAHEHAPALT